MSESVTIVADKDLEPLRNGGFKEEQNGSAYQICTRCIMDTSDPDIAFDRDGICNHCKQYEELSKEQEISDKNRIAQLDQILKQIKADGKYKQYDCVLGISGGVDSTYTAYQTKKLGLRPLAVHLDNGWDAELAVKNIENICKKLDIDLYTHVLDWEEFRGLQVAFLKASTPDSEIPTDHAIQSALYHAAARNGVQYVMGGQNIATEGYGPPAWSQGHMDWKYILSVNRKFGNRKLKTFPHFGLTEFLRYKIFNRIYVIPLLDYLDYNKEDAMKILENELEWKYYGGKHYESIYTHFFQAYILPKKFGYDKRRMHLSSLVASGQITREEALNEMELPLYDSSRLEDDKAYILKKLGLTQVEFEALMNATPMSFWNYPSYKRFFSRFGWLIKLYHRRRW